MSKTTISLTPRWKLELKLTKIKGVYAEPLIPSLRMLRRSRRGNKFSRIFRHIFQHSKIKKILGTNLVVLSLIGSYLPTTTNALVEPEFNIIELNTTEFKTNNSVRNPVNFVRITQKYSFYHTGLDFDGVTGDMIYPVMKGVVIETNYARFAYGNAVIIDHGAGLTSLYAHLSKIYVKQGESVDINTPLGEMGATGRASGDHLHLEIRDHGRAFNPFNILPL